VKRLNSLQPVALLFLRLTLGLIFVFHGYPKVVHPSSGLAAAFGEHGLPRYYVQVSGIVETFGGALLAMGLFTRGAALLLALEMSVEIWKFHSHSYLAVHEYEFPLVLAAATFALACVGAGTVSLDYALFERGGGSPPRVSRKPK
jgi:putative oxidoreductase